MSGFQPLKTSISNSAKRHQIEDRYLLRRISDSWSRVVEAFVRGAADISRAVTLHRGVLTVACLSAQAAQELERFSSSIAAAINSLLGMSVVSSISVDY